jgi:hypothetical protein
MPRLAAERPCLTFNKLTGDEIAMRSKMTKVRLDKCDSVEDYLRRIMTFRRHWPGPPPKLQDYETLEVYMHALVQYEMADLHQAILGLAAALDGAIGANICPLLKEQAEQQSAKISRS